MKEMMRHQRLIPIPIRTRIPIPLLSICTIFWLLGPPEICDRPSVLSVVATEQIRGWENVEPTTPSFPVFEHYLASSGGEFSLNDDHMRFYIHPDNTPSSVSNTVQGQQAAGFHGVSLYGTSRVCILWSHASTPGSGAYQTQDVSYFGIAKNLESIRRDPSGPTLEFTRNYRTSSHNFDHQQRCFNVESESHSESTYGVGVGAQCSSGASVFVDVKVWKLWKEMKDGSIQNMYPINCPAGTVPADGIQENVSCEICRIHRVGETMPSM